MGVGEDVQPVVQGGVCSRPRVLISPHSSVHPLSLACARACYVPNPILLRPGPLTSPLSSIRFDDHSARLSRPAVWGDNTELVALAEMLDRGVEVTRGPPPRPHPHLPPLLP